MLNPVQQGQPGHYQKYNWDTDQLDQWVDVDADMPLVVEGLGILSPQIRSFFDVVFVVTCPKDVRLSRGVQRDGEAMRKQWTDIWMPNEDRYFALRPIHQHADFVLDGQDPTLNTPTV